MGGNTILRKGLAAGIVLLFIGTCVIPAIDDFTIVKKIKNGNFYNNNSRDSPPDEEWNKTYYIPSKWDTSGNCIQLTPDGGYIVTGYAGGAERYSVYLLKIDSQGNELWNRTFGNGINGGNWVEVTSDNGYIITGMKSTGHPYRVTSETVITGDNNPGNSMAGASFSPTYFHDIGEKITSPKRGTTDDKFYAFDVSPGDNSVWFDPATPGTLNYIGPNTAPYFISAGVWAAGVWYGVCCLGGLYTIDPDTGTMTLIGGSTPLLGLGYDDNSETLYGCDSTNLYKVDISTGATTLVGAMGNAGIMIDMAIDSNGNAYGHDIVDDSIYSIDLVTGAATLIGPTGIDCSYTQGMGFDKDNNVLYLAAYTYDGALYTVDVTTGHATFVGDFQGGDEVDGLAIPYWNWYHYDVWLIKTDANGNEEWNKTFGGGGDQSGSCVKQTNDGGYILTGGDTGKLLLIKTDALGNKLWNKTYENSSGHSLELTTDGGYIITGGRSPYKLLLMKTDENGSMEWEKEFFPNSPYYYSGGGAVQLTSDGGYIVGGTSRNDNWSTEILLLKTDENGSEQWNRTFGNSGWDEWDYGYTVIETVDGDYILGGTQLGQPGFVTDKFWLIRTHSDGSVVWDHFYLPSLSARCYCLQQTLDNGLIATGVVDMNVAPKCVILKINAGNNHPPSSSTIEGPHWGVLNDTYSFCINATDPDGDPLYCTWDWGDGNISEWLGPYPPNETFWRNHSWSQKGMYEIRVNVKDKFGHESNWSEPHIFNVGELKIAFLLGRYTNMTTESDYRTVDAVNLRIILFKPIHFFHYTAGEKITFVRNNTKALITPRFIIGMVDTLI
jgi:hypothetical protein